MRRLRWVLRILLPVLVLAAGVAGLAVLTSLRAEPERVPPAQLLPVVETLRAPLEEQQLTVRSHGTVTPRTETRLVAEVSGRVTAVAPSFVEGGFFEAGDVLLRLETTDYEALAEEALATLRQAELRLAQEEADAGVARRDWAENGTGEASALVLREPQLARARAELAAAEARVAKARRDVERCAVVAPFPGRVRMRAVELGQFVARGGALAEVQATDWAEVRLPLPDHELAFLDLQLTEQHDGDALALPEVALRGQLGGVEHTWHGTLVRTEGELDPLNRMLYAVAHVADPYARAARAGEPPLLMGMFVEARIAGRKVQATRLPRAALRGADQVLLLVEDQVRFLTVEVLQGDHREVLVQGLTPDDRVVVTPLENAVDGMRVQAVEVD